MYSTDNQFFNDRMELLQLDAADYSTNIKKYDSKTNADVLEPIEMLQPDEKGIRLTPVSIDRHLILAKKDDAGKRTGKHFSIIRLAEPLRKDNGDLMKYMIPKGQGTPPLLPPALLDAYEAKQKIKTLYITEGYLKALKATACGLFTIGLVSITCMKDKETGKFHSDVLKLIDVCKVERVVWLTDADCRSLTTDEITETKDLYTRVFGFYNSVIKFTELLSNCENVKLYFAHINENLECKSKGIDDLLIAHPDDTAAILDDANRFDTIGNNGYDGKYFTKFYVSAGLSKVRNYFLLQDVTQFYLHHVEIRKELKGQKFKFNGTLYSYDEESGKCKIEVPKSAKDYFRVGDQYYEYVKIPDQYGDLTNTYHGRQKSTIKDDNGDIFKHIEKYKAFCNVPNHANYQRVIDNCFNLYQPFEYDSEPGDFDTTLNYIKHLFGTEKITLSTGKEVEYYELALDYLTILYKQPTQILPILCLVSKERGTGKTTFLNYLKILFGENVASVGNQDFENGFNAHWASKLIVAVDETKIDKQHVVEKIKSLSTATSYMMNAKGKDQVNIRTFLKFILLSNNDDSFINIDKEEVRFWVIKVPVVDSLIFEIEKKMQEEIPAFLHFLENRKMVTEKEFRHWFNNDYLRTDALKKVQENSAPTLWKILKGKIETVFLDHDIQELNMTATQVKEVLLKGYRYEDLYIKQILKERGYTLGPPQRGKYPIFEDIKNSHGDTERKGVFISFNGRAYTFKREDFTNTTADIEFYTTNPTPPKQFYNPVTVSEQTIFGAMPVDTDIF